MPSKRTNDSVDRILEDLNRRQAEADLRSGATDQQVNDILRSLGLDDDTRAASVNPNTVRLGPISQNGLPEVELGKGGVAFSTDTDADAIIRELERQQQELAGLSSADAPARPASHTRRAAPKAAEEPVRRPAPVQPEPAPRPAPAQPQAAEPEEREQLERTDTNGEIKNFLRQALPEDSQDTTVIRQRQAQFKDFFGEMVAVVPDENGKLPPEKKPRRRWFGGKGGEAAERTGEFVPINVPLSRGKKAPEPEAPAPEAAPAEPAVLQEPAQDVSEPPRQPETPPPARRAKPKKGWFASLFGGDTGVIGPEEEDAYDEYDETASGDEPEEAAPPRRPEAAIRWESEPQPAPEEESPLPAEEPETPVQVSDDTLNTLSSLTALNKAREAERAARRAGRLSAPATQEEPDEAEDTKDLSAPAAPEDSAAPKKKRDTVEFTPGAKPRAPRPSEPTRTFEPVGEPVMGSADALRPVAVAAAAKPGTGDTDTSFSVHMEAVNPEMLRPAQPVAQAQPGQASYAEQRDGEVTEAFAARLGGDEQAPDTAQFVNGVASNILSGTAQTTPPPAEPQTGKYESAAHLLIEGQGEEELPEQGESGKKARRGKKPSIRLNGLALGGTPADEEADNPAPPFEESGAADHHEHDYEKTEDAPAVRAELDKKVLLHTVSAIVSGVAALVLLCLGTAAGSKVIALPAPLDPLTAPGALIGVCLVLLAVAAGACWQTVGCGLAGLITSPTADTMPALAAAGAAAQLVVYLLKEGVYDPAKYYLFAGPAALLLCFNAIGKALDARTVRDSFEIVSAGVDHAAAYRLREPNVVHAVTRGLGEARPFVVVSRPTVLLKGFLADSYSHRTSDKLQQQFAWGLGACSLVVLAYNLLFVKDAARAMCALAGVLCLGAPLAGTLISALPAQRMQQRAARVGAVVPGWKDIRQLGRANVIQVTARDLFPAGCVKLFGIRTVRKERIDMAIVYAASILVKGSSTLRDVFLGMLGGNSKLLHQVDDLKSIPGKGFVAWVDGSRMLVGNRALLEEYGVPAPPMEYEQRMTGSSNRKAIYLAASGNLVGMFIVGYARDEDTALVLEGLRRRGMSLIVSSDDFNCDARLVEAVYSLPAGTVKVLSGPEMEALAPATAWLPESEGCMVHLGSFASFVGGLQAAAGAAEGERRASAVLTVSVLLSTLFGVVISFTGGIATLPLPAMVLYQAAWCVLALIFPLIQKY